jgi:hydrogenase maturation factor
VLKIDEDGLAAVRTSRGVEQVDTTLVAPVGPGDLVLVHAGTAIAVLGDEHDQNS